MELLLMHLVVDVYVVHGAEFKEEPPAQGTVVENDGDDFLADIPGIHDFLFCVIRLQRGCGEHEQHHFRLVNGLNDDVDELLAAFDAFDVDPRIRTQLLFYLIPDGDDLLQVFSGITYENIVSHIESVRFQGCKGTKIPCQAECFKKKTPDKSRAFAFGRFRWLGLCGFRFDRKDGDDGTTFSRTEVDSAVN